MWSYTDYPISIQNMLMKDYDEGLYNYLLQQVNKFNNVMPYISMIYSIQINYKLLCYNIYIKIANRVCHEEENIKSQANYLYFILVSTYVSNRFILYRGHLFQNYIIVLIDTNDRLMYSIVRAYTGSDVRLFTHVIRASS